MVTSQKCVSEQSVVDSQWQEAVGEDERGAGLWSPVRSNIKYKMNGTLADLDLWEHTVTVCASKSVQRLTTVQQRGQNHQSRTRASRSNRAKSSHSAQVPSDCSEHTVWFSRFISRDSGCVGEFLDWMVDTCAGCGVYGDGAGDEGLSTVKANKHFNRPGIRRTKFSRDHLRTFGWYLAA